FTVYRGVSLLDLAGPLEAFRVADAFAPSRSRRASYECLVVSSSGGRVMTADGVELNTTPVRSAAKDPIDTLVVPGGFFVDDVTRDRALVKWIAQTAPGCRRVRHYYVNARLLRGPDHVLCLFGGGRQRLFAENMLAGLHRPDGPFGMQAV